MKRKCIAIILLSGMLLSGCSGFKSSAPPPALYLLHARQSGAPAMHPQRIISVAEPAVPAGFDSNRIAVYIQHGRRMDFAAGAEWPAPLPKVLQDFIVQSASASPGVMAVLPDSGIAATISLLVRVNDFEAAYENDQKAAPLLKASMTFTFISLTTQRIITSFTIGQEKAASANTLTSITEGLEAMAQDLITQAFQKARLFQKTRGMSMTTAHSNARERQ